MTNALSLRTDIESWPIEGGFTIARGSKTQADVVIATLSDGVHAGRGECVPYARYGESIDGVRAEITAQADACARGMDRASLQSAMPPGAARNALDCAYWDLEAKRAGKRVWDLTGTPKPVDVVTAFTLSLKSADEMHTEARAAAHRPLIKVKLGSDGDRERIAAVRQGAPDSRLIIDANEGWTPANMAGNLRACQAAGVELIEQPLPASDDDALRAIETDILICADESAHDTSTLSALAGKYTAINIKLDKTGGLTEALALAQASRDAGLTIMVGCMLATSLAMAPALIVGADAEFVDLDGPLLLTGDRDPGLVFDGSHIRDLPSALWG